MWRNMASWKWTPYLAMAIGLIIGGLAYASITPKGPPRAVAEPTSQRVIIAPGANKITATFKVWNRGGRDLILGEVRTTCGCSVASIQPKILKPGHRGIITVEGTPLNAGEKTVRIHVETNTEEGLLSLSLTMIGAKQTPYVAIDSGPIRFGIIRSRATSESIRIETREKKSEKPWIETATSDLPVLVIHGGLTEERPMGGDIVLRCYQFTAELARIPETGSFTGEAIFKTRGPDTEPALKLPVHGTVRPPVFAAPSSLYASYGPNEEAPTLTLTLASDNEFELKAEPVADLSDALAVRCVSQEGARVVFKVSRNPERKGSVSTSIAFKTNHPETPLIRVPIVFRSIDP